MDSQVEDFFSKKEKKKVVKLWTIYIGGVAKSGLIKLVINKRVMMIMASL